MQFLKISFKNFQTLKNYLNECSKYMYSLPISERLFHLNFEIPPWFEGPEKITGHEHTFIEFISYLVIY